MADFVREALTKHAQIEQGDVTQLDELAEFFADPDEEEITPDEESGESDLDATITILAKAPRQRVEIPADAHGEGDGESRGAGGGGGGGGGGDGGGNGGAGTKRRQKIPLEDIRCVVQSDTTRQIYFTPTVSATAEVVIQDAGADVTYPLWIKKVTGGGRVKNGKIVQLPLITNKRKMLTVTLSENFYGSLRVIAHEI